MTKTVVFIHGAFTNPACWQDWIALFEGRGVRCLAPAWPHNDGDVATLRAKPDPQLAGVGVAEIVDHYAAAIEALPERPWLIGHSFGGLFVQLLLARGLGKGGVAIHPAPPRGIPPAPDAIKSNFPVLKVWGGHKKLHTMSFQDFCGGFDNGRPEAEQRAAYDRWIVPTPGRPFFQAGFAPFHSITEVDWMARKVPLAIFCGGADKQVPASMNEANHRKYAKNPATTELIRFEDRNHLTIGVPGWESVATRALDWLETQAP